MGFWKAGFFFFCWYSFICKEGPSAIVPVVIPSEEKCCIASLCAAEAPWWDQKFMLRMLVALWPRAAESGPWGTEIGSPKQAACWQYLVFEPGASTCFTPALGVSKRHIRHWFILALQLSQTGVQDSWALSPWTNAHQQAAVRAPSPAPRKLPQPNKAFSSLQKRSCNLHVSKTLHFRKSYILFHKHRHLLLIKVAAYNYTLSY